MTQPRKKTPRRRPPPVPPEPKWAGLPEAQLLDLRLSDLDLRIEGTWVAQCITRLYEELDERGLEFRPHFWISNEFFAPDGVPGIAIPFYLVHPRLMRLEKKMMLEVEGGTRDWCLRILRHEAAHAIDSAYRLHFKRSWQHMFGSYAQPYPEFYAPKPYSRSYVLHLDMWYAQAHPAEDFAETFAVWLKPNSRWQQRYKGWPALAKLEYVDELMEEISDARPIVATRRQVEPLRELKQTLREHYKVKRLHYGTEWPDFYDAELRRIFSDEPRHRRNEPAARFLNRQRPELRRLVARWTGEYQYTIDQVLIDMIYRCRELGLRVALPRREARLNAIVMVTVQTMNYLHDGRHRVAL